jgi:hypothetical protein
MIAPDMPADNQGGTGHKMSVAKGSDKAAGTQHAVMTSQAGAGSTPLTPRNTGKKKKRSGKPRVFPIPLVKVTKWTGQQTETHDLHLKEELLPYLSGIGGLIEARVIRIDPDHWAIMTKWKNWPAFHSARNKTLLSPDEMAERFPGVKYVSGLIGKRAEEWLAEIDGTHSGERPADTSVTDTPVAG